MGVVFKRSEGDEEKSARESAKLEKRTQDALRKSAEGEQKRLRQDEERREQLRTAFFATAGGQARTAFERGDRVFQFYMDVKNTTPIVIPMGPAKTTTTSADPVAILNAVCNEGWDMVNGSFVFHELGSESRDKFLASGQNVAVRGTIIGYYLFRRCDENRVGTQDPWVERMIDRACPHCGEQIQAAATTCAHCGNTSDAWQLSSDGRWLRPIEGEWEVLNEDAGTWAKY